MILTITGPSASGKTSLARALRVRRPEINLLKSTTTRTPRPSDMPGEYEYVTESEFTEIEQSGDFIWTVEVHGNRYGTRKSGIDEAASSGIFIAIVIVSAVVSLRSYLGRNGSTESIRSVYLDIADEKMLHARLTKRGDTSEDIDIRINECKSWARQRDACDVPFTIHDARTNSDELAAEIVSSLPQA